MFTSLPLILLPGLGADRRLFVAQAAVFDNLATPDWIPPQPAETLPSYACRMARAIDPGGPCFVGGASFGGMVAVEMSQHLKAKACFLIGSVRSPDELPRRIRRLRPLARVVPPGVWQLSCRSARAVLAVAGRFMGPTTRSVFRQFAASDGGFMRWAAVALLRWEAPAEPSGVPVCQIHGDRDHVLPHRLTRPDVLVHGAGHLLPMTFPDAVNQFLRSRMEEIYER